MSHENVLLYSCQDFRAVHLFLARQHEHFLMTKEGQSFFLFFAYNSCTSIDGYLCIRLLGIYQVEISTQV